MIDSGAVEFLQQAHRNNWQRYLASLQPTARQGWDLCILTASDERQADMYRRQLAWRRTAGLLPSRTEFQVLPDPHGQRIGSGGATLRALAQIVGRRPKTDGAADDLATRLGKRVLIVHSGGDSRRLPHCSASGKLFARVPRTLPDGRASTIFDEFLISLSGLPLESPAGALIASGDVLLVFDHLQLSFQRGGVIGVAAAAPAEMGTRHGVYVSEAAGRPDVRAYLHKADRAELLRWGALAADGTVQIDTGLVWLDAPTVGRLAALAAEEEVAALCGLSPTTSGQSLEGSLNLYGDLLLPLAASTTFDRYLADVSDGPATAAVQSARRVIWQRMRGTPLTVERLQPAAFVHFGTSFEYWRMVADDPLLARMCGWDQVSPTTSAALVLINAVIEEGEERPGLTAGGSSTATGSAATGTAQPAVATGCAAALIVDSDLAAPQSCLGPAIVANVCTTRALRLPTAAVLHQLPIVEGGYVTRLFGLYDDPKCAWNDPRATFMNRPWAEWAGGDAGLIAALWPGLAPEQRSLWNAQLYPRVPDREESLALTLPLADPAQAPTDWRARWLAAERLSLAESFWRADGAAILTEAAAIEDEVAALRFYRAVIAEQPASEARSLLGAVPDAAVRRSEIVGRRLSQADPVIQLRGYKALAVATGDLAWEDRAFAVLAAMIERDTLSRARPVHVPAGERAFDRSATTPPDRQTVLWARAAARIDFGGGWTDTPPYSIERGGTVLNAAITLRGQHPVVVTAERLSAPALILESRDIGATLAPRTVGELLDYANPADPFALLKAAVVLRGIVPAASDPQMSLAELLGPNGGLRLSTQTFIPRGSGLGTSSILAGAVLACLARFLGVALSQAQLFDEVLCLEQMLTTGGGWQDQVGGLTGGIKLVTTEPGLPQHIRVAPLSLSAATARQLTERLLLVYTGQQRLAKNLLRNVMGRWMARDREMVWILDEIARLAVAMRDALVAGDLDSFGRLLGEHWQLNKRMDIGCTNPFIDGLFETMAPYIHGGKLAGAGGGGYAMLIARDGQAARDLAEVLARRYPGTPVAVWPCGIPAEGLVIEAAAS